MRIGIREQLAVVILLTSLLPLAILAVATWINNKNFVVNITSQDLSLTASLKAAQIASGLQLIQSTCATITTRILLNQALKSYYRGNQTSMNWAGALQDVTSALDSGGFSSLLQIQVFSRNSTSGRDERSGGASPYLFRVTAPNAGIRLPSTYPDGTTAKLGDETDLGYPTQLYPNITYTTTEAPDPIDPSVQAVTASAFADLPLNSTSELLLGPLQVNDSYALLSLTLPITDNDNKSMVLGYMTVVAAATSLISVTQTREGLADTGIVLLVSPDRRENLFEYEQRPSSANYTADPGVLEDAIVRYVFPPLHFPGQIHRHEKYVQNLTNLVSPAFSMKQFPAAVDGFAERHDTVNNASSHLKTTNEQGESVAIGFARPQSSLVSWLLLVEQSHSEAYSPIERLRTIVLACVLGTVGLVLAIVLPIVHYSVRPIRRLRDATEKSMAPPGYTPNGSMRSDVDDREIFIDGVDESEHGNSSPPHSKKGVLVRLRQLTSNGRRKSHLERKEVETRRVFKIPGKVRDRKHYITDELTELTATFNEMLDELTMQYSSLERKVAERTEELEISKRAAEAANESKTLFIANISHELKTPLNGILGMCAVCMGEDDLPKIKRSLGIVYKSGDLLLHLLNDLLLFSKNQIGQQLTLDEKEFRLSDIKTQILTIFATQVQESNITFGVKFLSTDTETDRDLCKMPNGKPPPATGPAGVGRLKDLCLWGDQHRILQVIINLVSNSLKFTPEGGRVEVRIKCLGDAESMHDGSRSSTGSKQSSQLYSKSKKFNDRASNTSHVSRQLSNSSQPALGTALQINPMNPRASPRISYQEGPQSPPPPGARTLLFQFEVEDTGPGIPEQLKDRVFEPFVQGDLGLSKKYGGTGLGLSICSQLAGLMGGSITLSDVEPHGSAFTMRIPLKHIKSRPPSTSSSDCHPSRPPSLDLNRPLSPRKSGEVSPMKGFEKDSQLRLVGLSQPFFTATSPIADVDPNKPLTELSTSSSKEASSRFRVLVAEDNLINIEIVLRMLKLEEIYDVVVAKDGREAYDQVRENMAKGEYFDLIFMDVQMPNLDGLQSTRMIRQMGYSAPIVALTAFAEESNVKDCYDSGMDMFLSKPIRRPALKQILEKFATIPEESESPSVTKSSITISEADPCSPSKDTDMPVVNGTPPHPPA